MRMILIPAIVALSMLAHGPATGASVRPAVDPAQPVPGGAPAGISAPPMTGNRIRHNSAPNPAPTQPTRPPAIMGPSLPPVAAPGSPSISTRHAAQLRLTAARLRQIAELEKRASPRSGYGSTPTAATAAWTLGLIRLHQDGSPVRLREAARWFRRAAQYGKQPLAHAGLAWCAIDGCGSPPDPSAAKQAIASLHPYHPARALFLQWLLERRLQPIRLRTDGPEGIGRLRLPAHELLERAARAGDVQARLELGIEAVVNNERAPALRYFRAAAAHSPAAAANLGFLEQPDRGVTPATPQARQAQELFERARATHRGVATLNNYMEALRMYQAAAAMGSVPARNMLALITSHLGTDGRIDAAWMAQLARMDMLDAGSLPRLAGPELARFMTRDPTPLFDLLPAQWQSALSSSN